MYEMSKIEPNVILVDENDHEIGIAKKLEAHQKALCHRAFSVFLLKYTSEGVRLLLQQRNPNKYHCGGLWTNTCCSHPYPGELTEVAAKRRLQEEMGIVADVEFIAKFHYIAAFENGLTENEVDHVFIARFKAQDFTVNSEEVSDYQWVLLEELLMKVQAQPAQYTPWLLQSLQLVLKYLADRPITPQDTRF